MHDVIVIGAGASGLKAAADLARAGCAGLVIDARERIGGRIYTRALPDLPVPVELGAEFIHGLAQPVFDLIAKAGGAAIDTGGEHWSLQGRELHPSAELFADIRRAMRDAKTLKKQDVAFDTFLDEHLTDALSPEARESARMLAQGFDAADTQRASARAIVEEWTGGASVEAPQFRPLGGYAGLLAQLAAELRGSGMQLQLNTEVRAIRWRRERVHVRGTFQGRAFEVTAKRSIVTLPLGVLQLSPARGGVRFTPSLTGKRDALRHLAPGPVLKVLLRFRSRFWETLDNGRYRNAAFFHAPQARFPTFWTALPVRTPVVVAWAAGPKAAQLSGAGTHGIVRQALSSFERLFAGRADVRSQLESATFHDWQNDPYARGAYSYVKVGGDKAREALARPLLDTLFFGGEAADSEGEAGTVAGALRSGSRAAREALAAMRT